MDLSHPRLARDVIRLVIAIIRLITAVLILAGGATNYPRRCLAPTSTSSSFRTGIRCSSLRRLAAELVQWCTQICCAAGDRLTTSIICVVVGMSPPSERTFTIAALRL